MSRLRRDQQKAYWINLYNAYTVKIVLDHYPVESIQNIRIQRSGIDRGPWKSRIISVEGQSLSLDDIEHGILRKLWEDNRIHYGLNCASIGCPNLQPEPFTADNMERLLDKSAREYVNHPRGVTVKRRALVLSSIYKWYPEDFGGSEQGVLDHLIRYADPELAERLTGFSGRIRYSYGWRLNDTD